MDSALTQPPFRAQNDGLDHLRTRYYNLRESALAFGMQRSEFNTLADVLLTGIRADGTEITPAVCVKVGNEVQRTAMDRWRADRDAQREARRHARSVTERSFADSEERRQKRYSGRAA